MSFDTRKNINKAKQMLANEKGAGIVGGTAGAAIGIKLGGLAAAGLAIGGSAMAIPAVAVVAIPAAAGVGVGVTGYWTARKINDKLKERKPKSR